MNNLFRSLRDFIFRNDITCEICGRDVFAGELFCSDCQKQVVKNDGAICDRCGRWKKEDVAFCEECKAMTPDYEKARSVYAYNARIMRLVMRLKNGKRYVAERMATEMLPTFLQEFSDADVIVCTPMEKTDEQKRGYNQARLIAENLSRLSGVCFSDCLKKIKRTESQKTLKKRARLKNMRDCFLVEDAHSVQGKTVVIIDDVLTTGSTVESLSRELYKAGAARVCALTFASVPLEPIVNETE